MRRAVDSIGANIKEGCAKRTGKDYISYLHNASGSVNETKHPVESACRGGYISKEDEDRYLKELDEIGRMIYGVIRFVEKKNIV